MYKLILFIMILAAESAAQNNHEYSPENSGKNLKTFEELHSAIEYETQTSNVPQLNDLKNKILNGLNFMNPGSFVTNLICEKATSWSESCSEKLLFYLNDKYGKIKSQRDPHWIESVIINFRNAQCYFGILNWEVNIDGKLYKIKSIAVFDPDWKVLFDTELVNYIVNVGDVETDDEEKDLPGASEVIKNERSGTANANYNVNGTFGSVRLTNQVNATAIAPPYVAASINDAAFNFFTTSITSRRTNESGIPPSADPFLYFGIDGHYAALYQNADPYYSDIYLSDFNNTTDKFNSGLYQVSGSNGLNWTFNFDFSVSILPGGIGITPQSNISSLSLSSTYPTLINLDNYTYMHNAVTYDIRALFYEDGSLRLENFKLLTGPGGGESGAVNVIMPLRVGHHYDGAVSHQTFWHSSSSNHLSLLKMQYVRGDALLQPSYQLTSTRYNSSIGQIDTLKVKITNQSHVVGLSGGNVLINTSSLENKLTLLSPSSLPIGTIDTSASKIFKFVVRGNANGIVTPQAAISSLAWQWPVPSTVVINTSIGINNNIEVGPVTGTLSLNCLMQGFYNPGSNSMSPDTVSVYLRNSSSPYQEIDFAKARINSSGNAVLTYTNINSSIPYYIQVKHRNSIETWSAVPQSFVNTILLYDFTTSSSKAFGNNLFLKGSEYCFYGGDVNQDGSVDLTDNTMIDNDSYNYVSGYANTDLTGDNSVDLTDAAIADNNAFNFVSVIKP